LHHHQEGGTMDHAKMLKALTTAMVVITAASFSVVADAEKREQTCVKKNFRTASKTTFAIGDVPNHEVSQEMSVADMEFSNPDFKIKDEWTYIVSDTIDGSGTHSGYFMDTHMDGSTDYEAFKGALKPQSRATVPGRLLGRGPISTWAGVASSRT